MTRLVMAPDWEIQVKRSSVPTMRDISREIFDEYRNSVAVVTGELKSKAYTTTDPETGDSEIGNTASYAEDYERGTRPHIIRPKDGGELEFTEGGKKVFAKEVHHPGTKPEPRLSEAAYKYRGDYHA